MTGGVGANALEFHAVTAANVGAFEAFFAAPGAPKWCWCMVWRRTSAEAKLKAPADRKRMMMESIAAGTPVGLLAYDGDTPVGWVSVAPRETYRNLGGPPAKPGEAVWSIACFYVPRKRRGEGMIRRLIAGAVDHARNNGATVVEAYPVPPDAPSDRFMGFMPVFEKAGFTDVGMAGVRRHVMRLAV
jgi:GNAT superfamily N-acetyltransferase